MANGEPPIWATESYIRNHGSNSSNKNGKIVKEHRIQVKRCHYDERKKEFITVGQKNGEKCLRCEQNHEYLQSLLADCAKTATAEELARLLLSCC